MKYIHSILLCFATLLFARCQSSSNSGNTNAASAASYQNAKMTLEQQEQTNPTAYLKVTNGIYKKNLFGTWVIEGNTTSTATVAKYKDVVLTVKFYTKTNTLLGSQDFAQYEYVKPGQSVAFKIKTDGYQGTEQIGIDIKGASTAN